jgi:thiol-disulfide isomerase/thioredoxin
MKTKFLILILFISTSLSAFAQKNETTIQLTLPQTENWEFEKVSISYSNPALSELTNTVFFEQKDNSKNEWKTTVSLSTAQEWTINVGGELTFDLLLFPNDNLEIELDEEGAAKFLKGNTAKENQSTYNWLSNFYNQAQVIITLDPKEATQIVDSLINASLSSYEKAFGKSKPNPIFDTYFRTELKLIQIMVYNQYPYVRSRNLEEEDVSKILTEEYKKSIPIFKADLNADYPYTSLYLSHVYNNSLGENCVYKEEESRTEYLKCQYEELQKLSSQNAKLKKTLAFASADRVLQSIKMAGSMNLGAEEEQKLSTFLDELSENLNKEYPNTEEIAFLRKQIEINKKIATGSPAPNFSLKDKDGKTVSLADLKGKYVMIDFWATWCQPCLGEIPYAAKLEEEFSKDVTFVYICMSSKEDKWKEMVAEKPSEQVQLFVEGEAQEQIQEDYQVSFYPTYILLDREGKIITKNIRPSENGQEVLKQTIEAEK